MSKVTLRAYDHEIEGLIEQGRQLDEAVAHCRHILSTYPKHLETYRLLGKAYLEAKRYDQAVDIFRRVLVATPEDFVSHVGMSIIADDQGKLDEAIWHMERAFEVQPSNAAIQAELQRLFGRRDGVEPAKIRLTRGALAHMYVQGDLFTQAISEIRAVLAQDQNRMDMQVLLARAYYRNGQKAEAAEVCSALLAISPYCLDANRLMAELVPGDQTSNAGRDHRRRVIELDPYAEFAQGPDFNTDAVADTAVTLQRLEYVGEGAEKEPRLGIALEQTTGMEDAASSPPSWLRSSADLESPPASVPGAQNELPEFMLEAGWREVDAEASGVAAVEEAETGFEAAAVPGDLPEWVKALAPTAESEPDAGPGTSAWPAVDQESDREAATGASLGAQGAEPEEQAPDWLKDLAMGAERRGQSAPPPLRSAEAEGHVAPSEMASAVEPSRDQDDALAWLEGLAEKHGAKPEELTTPPESRPSEPPEWVKNAAQSGAPSELGWKPVGASQEGVSEGGEAEQAGAIQEPFDWLAGLSAKDAFAEMEKPAPGEEAPIIGERDEFAWTKAEDLAGTKEIPDWLAREQAPAAGIEEPIERESTGEFESAVNLPDWLAGLDRDQPASPGAAPEATPAPELPDWLQETGEVMPERAAGAALERPLEKTSPGQTGPAATGMEPPADAIAAGDWFDRETEAEVARAQDTLTQGPLPERTRPLPMESAARMPTLAGARGELGRGNIAAALDLYGRLIRKGRSLEEIIRDLRDALYRYPVEVPIWQSLGDAYMRANRLQEALDAYTKAEELLR